MDLRLAVPAGTCWLVTWLGLTGSRGLLVAAVLVSAGLAVAAASFDLCRPLADRVWRGAPVVVGAAGLAFGAAVALLVRLDRVEAHPLRQLDGGTAVVTISATEDPRVSAADPDVVWVRARLHTVDGRTVPGADLLLFASNGQRAAGAGSTGSQWLDLRVGQRVRVAVTVRVPAGRGLLVARVTARGSPVPVAPAPVPLRIAEMARARFREVCANAVGHREAGLLPGLVVGDTSLGEPLVDEQFRRSGLTHLSAVSGANFALIVGAVVLLVGVIGGSVRVTVGAGLVATIGFAVLVQLSPSVIRAAAMGGIGLLAMAVSRHRDAMPALAGAVVFALLVWPGLAIDAGFAMSVAATAALIAWSPSMRDRLVGRGMPRGVADALAMAIVAYLVTAPLVAAISGRLSVTAVLANLVVAPAVPVATLLGALAMALAAPGLPVPTALAHVLVAATEPALWWILAVARLLGGPWATIPAPPAWLFAVGAGAVVLGRRFRRRRRTGSADDRRGLARLGP